ncbi:radical SAM protein [Gelidibacter salicanalis]|uniref:Radical SAM protein n=1 Tax=Gelidibacter salicanalis TaxID=291193 RepID=A0A5C7ATY8_9FLAO|nr:radical SAM protein [Gelidibacter salicanalis]TXE09302.1 radical SAM protein [Gelidibacter salicanalis]
MTNLNTIAIGRQVTAYFVKDGAIHVPLEHNKIIHGGDMRWHHFCIRCSLLRIIITNYRYPLQWFRALKFLIRLRKRFLGHHALQKMVYAHGKYYMGLYTPGWNGSGYDTFIASQLNDFKKINAKVNRFNTVFVAVTKKCALQCEHCYEWDNLNKKDTLTTEKLMQTVAKLQHYGVSQIQFSGGEPLLKIESIIEVLRNANKTTEFWIATSGFKLTNQNAYNLKEAGLTGVIISLDHFIPEKHNAFRGFKDAYYWVAEAIKNANQNNLVVALSLCVTKGFISEENLMSYMHMAKKMGVGFVQFLEPKAVGHFANQDVHLQKEHIQILENFFLKLNYNKAYRAFPLITYHGYYQRREGCFSAGIKGIYLDTDGDINACPFCHKKTGNVLDASFEQHLATLKNAGCSSYN